MDLEYVFKMIKKSYYILVFIICISCSSENLNGCFQASGSIIETTFPVSGFTKIQIEGEVSLILKQGAVQEVVVETGENLLSNMYVNVECETLIIRDGNTCNLVRDYGITKVFVTTPNINQLRNSSLPRMLHTCAAAQPHNVMGPRPFYSWPMHECAGVCLNRPPRRPQS